MSWSVSVTVDVDGETGLPDGGRAYGHRLSSRSERLYGLRRGLPRVLDVLGDAGIRATFYVPGQVALRHGDEVCAIVAAGHELGHHGHTHRRPDQLSTREQRCELEEGLAALAPFTRGPVRGYRAPGWELTPATLVGLGELGFAYDSSLMGDDRPYRVAAGAAQVVELPVHWTLDDAPYFSGAVTDPGGLLAVWEAELAHAEAEQRHVTFTLHPEILGRPHRICVLQRLVELIRVRGARHVTHAEAAAAA
jgi:peptidoglycan/xylan/chitin deacetylase (PgdA/CDA1 family)